MTLTPWRVHFFRATYHLANAQQRLVEKVPLTPTLTSRMLDAFLVNHGGIAVFAGFVFGTVLVVLSEVAANWAFVHRRAGSFRSLRGC
jgi:hypothetical protein